MNSNALQAVLRGLARALCVMPAMLSSAHAQGTIQDYLFNHSAGPVAANDIIRVSGSVVSSLNTPKDLVLALGAVGDRNTQAGFGLAITPARTSLPGLALSASRYVEPANVLTRIWGGTSFSYAQNKKAIGGIDYAQSALAVNVTYSLFREDDPIVVAYENLQGGARSVCKVALDAFSGVEDLVDAFIRRRVSEEQQRLGRQLDLQEQQRIAAEVPPELAADATTSLKSLRKCAHDASTAVAGKWNKSRAQVVLGRGWIQGPASDASRLKLGTFASLSLALPAGDNGLLNLTLRRAGDQLDTATIAKTPAYSTTNSAGLRYTYRAGKANDLYGIAEVSNIKASSRAASSGEFKYAVGLDHKISGGLWLELRYGRSQVADGSKLENKALFSLKFSPETTLQQQIK